MALLEEIQELYKNKNASTPLTLQRMKIVTMTNFSIKIQSCISIFTTNKGIVSSLLMSYPS